MDNNIAVLKLFPGINKNITQAILNTKGIKAVILETFGAGNCTTEKWFTEEIKKAVDKGIIVLNITQCLEGRVVQGMYETSSHLKKIGVISGEDMTFESAVTKLMFLLGSKNNISQSKKLISKNIIGELTN